MRTTAWFLFSLLTFIKLNGQEQPVWDFHTKNVVIKSICNTLQRNYVFPDKAQLMIQFISQQNQDGAYESLTNPVEFTRQINKDIRFINHDKHLRIVYDVALDKDIIRFTSSKNGAENILKEDVIQDKKKEFSFQKGRDFTSEYRLCAIKWLCCPKCAHQSNDTRRISICG